MSIVEKIIVRLKNFFKPYIIYKIGDKYAVRGTIFAGLENAFVWIQKDGENYWCCETFRNIYCLVDTCEDAFKIIEQYKEVCREDKKFKKIKKQNEKVKLAYECYSNKK